MPDQALHHEKELLARISLGEEAAFRELFDHYWDHLYHYLVQVTKSPEIAEEIAGDVFLKLWTGRALLHRIRRLDAFLFRVAHNKAIDFLKLTARNQRMRQMVSQSIDSARAPAADHLLLDREAQQMLAEVVAKLSPRRRLVFTLSRMEGLSNEEIASRLHLSPNTVKNTLGDSMRAIRIFLARRGIHGLLLLSILFPN